jgi:hypothetical protein
MDSDTDDDADDAAGGDVAMVLLEAAVVDACSDDQNQMALDALQLVQHRKKWMYHQLVTTFELFHLAV